MTGINLEGDVTNSEGERMIQNIAPMQYVLLESGEAVTAKSGFQTFDDERKVFVLDYSVQDIIVVEKVKSVVVDGVEIEIK